MPAEDDTSEHDLKHIKRQKHTVQKELKLLFAELESVRKMVATDKQKLDEIVENESKDAQKVAKKDDTQKSELEQSRDAHLAREKTVADRMADVEPQLKALEVKLAEALSHIKTLEKSRLDLFVTEQVRLLKPLDEAAIKALCNRNSKGMCQHSVHKGSEEATLQVVHGLYGYLKLELQDRTEEHEDEQDQDAPGADVRSISCLKYNLRCLLHSSVKLTTQMPSEWKESTDKKSGEVSWTNMYTGARRLEKPSLEPVLLNTKTHKSFVRRFKDWKRTGVVLGVSDKTTWLDMRNSLLPHLLQQRFEIVSYNWVTVRTEEEWEHMKSTLSAWSMFKLRVVVAREAALPKRKAVDLVPVGWQVLNITPAGWQRVYDLQAAKFKFINTNDVKADPRWQFPLDRLDQIEWPDGSKSTGTEVSQALGTAPSSIEDPSNIFINFSAQLVAWAAPKKTAEVCSVRVRLPAGTDSKMPSAPLDVKDAFVPILLMEHLAGGAAKEIERKEALKLPYTMQPGGPLGGFVVTPGLEWKDMLTMLKDKIEPKGKDRIFQYATGARSDSLSRVRAQREWDECVQSHMLQVRLQMMASASNAASPAASNLLRMRIFPLDHPSFKLEVLDSLPSDDKNCLPVEGTALLDGALFEIRASLDVKQSVSFATIAEELKELCKAASVFRFHEPRLVSCDASWLSTLEQLYAPVVTKVQQQTLRVSHKPDAKHHAEITISLDDDALDFIIDEGTHWLHLIAEVRRVSGGSIVGLLHEGNEVREEAGYKKMVQRVLKDRHALSNLQKVHSNVLNILRGAFKEDPKQGALALELARRTIQSKKQEEKGEAATDGQESSGETILRIKISGCKMLYDHGSSRLMLEGQMEIGLRTFRFVCRRASPDEEGALVRFKEQHSTLKQLQDQKKSKNIKAEEADKSLVFEIMRRTRKGKQKVKGLLLLHDQGEKIFALSPTELTGPGQGLRKSISCCPSAQAGGTCCAGLAWDARCTLLQSAVTINEGNNVFCYNGPTLARVKAGTYSLAQLAAKLWNGVMASGLVPQDLLQVFVCTALVSHKFASLICATRLAHVYDVLHLHV